MKYGFGQAPPEIAKISDAALGGGLPCAVSLRCPPRRIAPPRLTTQQTAVLTAVLQQLRFPPAA
ncbi:MAG TPA: hypothetical protein VIH96_01135, partial [Paraburkholderia sp.]